MKKIMGVNNMPTYLTDIIAEKTKYVAALKAKLQNDPKNAIAKILQQQQTRTNQPIFKQALTKAGLSIIAEIKRRSPSKGHMADIADPVVLAQHYIQGGASAISILTDSFAFGGSLTDLTQVKTATQQSHCPILQKDFILDPVQIAEAVNAGADAILIIIAAVQEKAADLLNTARALNIDALVEVNSREELDMALELGADIIGVNNRNLHTFVEDIQTAFELIQHIPDHVTKVAASAIRTPDTAKELHQAGFDAVLIGEMLVKAENPTALIKAMCA